MSTPDATDASDLAENEADFLKRVLPWPQDGAPGVVNLHYTKPDRGWMPGYSFTKVEDFVTRVLLMKNRATHYKDIYFCLSSQAKVGKIINGKTYAARHKDDALALKAVWLDIDVKDPPKGYATINNALDALEAFTAKAGLPAPSAIVHSGGGLHVYWIANRPLKLEEWRPYSEGLKLAGLAAGLRSDWQCTTNSVRVLRIPGTLNHKTNPPRAVKLLALAPTDYDFATALSHIKAAPSSTPQRKITALSDVCDITKFTGPPVHIEGFDGDLGLQTYSDVPLALEPLLEASGCPHLLDAFRTGGAFFFSPFGI